MDNAPAQPRPVLERLAELFRRLHSLPRAKNAEEALQQLCDTLDEVEDLWSGMPKKTPPPLPTESDGRMYCPLEDYIARSSDGSIVALTRGHRIEIGSNGTMRIISKITDQAEFEK
jgi:hypothetical protein